MHLASHNRSGQFFFIRHSLWQWLAGFLAAVVPTTAPLCADLPLPASLLAPQAAAEAWNVIRLATKNVERLMAENRME